MYGLHLYGSSLSSFSFEDDGKTHAEIERVYYGLISDKGWVQLKNVGEGELQEQWTCKTDKGSCRVRAYHGKKEYEATVKSENIETNSIVSKDFFNHFKSISDNGMIKRRFNFPIDTSQYSSEDKVKWEGLKWELDVFVLPNGEFAPWCKLDLEVKSEDQLRDGTRPEFPIDFKEVIVNEGDAKKLVRRLYEDYFICKKNDISVESEALAVVDTLIETHDVNSVAASIPVNKTLFEQFLDNYNSEECNGELHHELCTKLCEYITQDGGRMDTFYVMYTKGPLDAGDVPSKSSRDDLMEQGIVIATINEGQWCYGLHGCCEVIWKHGIEYGYWKQ